MKYTDFVAGLGVTLTAGQLAMSAVAFDGGDLDGGELCEELFGSVTEIPDIARRVVVIKKGARIGGSYLSALRALHLATTVSLERMAPGEVASAIIVAPDLRLARQTLRFALGAARSTPELASAIASETEDSFTLSLGRHDVVIECLPATRGGTATRGRSLVAAVFSECAFFRDADFVVNDEELYRAVLPRIMPGGQLVIESTPWAEAGLLYQLFADNFGAPKTALAVDAPTLTMRDDEHTRGIVEMEYERDPENARREFGAEFMTAGSGLFFDAEALERCLEVA